MTRLIASAAVALAAVTPLVYVPWLVNYQLSGPATVYDWLWSDGGERINAARYGIQVMAYLAAVTVALAAYRKLPARA